MHQILLILILVNLWIKSLCSENIQVTTPTSQTPLATFNPNSDQEKPPKTEDNIILNAIEAYNKPEPPQTQQVQTGYMYPIYPTGYFYPGVTNAVAAPMSQEMKSYNYFSAVLPAAQMGFEILRNLFLYLLVRHFVLKVVKLFDLILDIREVLVTDELSNFLTKAALQAGLKLFAKLGLFLMGGAGLLVLGGIFTTLMCYLTPICTISFAGYYDFNKALDKETMRSLMTPEKIASAAALVQDAIGKYQRLQREVGQ